MTLEKLKRTFHKLYIQKWICPICGYKSHYKKEYCEICGGLLEYRRVKK